MVNHSSSKYGFEMVVAFLYYYWCCYYLSFVVYCTLLMFFSDMTECKRFATLYCGDVHVMAGFAGIRFGTALNGYQSGNQHVCNPFFTGCESCGCTHYHPNPSSKSEALCQVSLGKGGGKAGADLTSCLFPTVIFSASVISSSSCGTAEPPSHVTSHGAEQVGNLLDVLKHKSFFVM